MSGGMPGKIFIGGMPYAMTEDDLKEKFEKYGVVTDCKYIILLFYDLLRLAFGCWISMKF